METKPTVPYRFSEEERRRLEDIRQQKRREREALEVPSDPSDQTPLGYKRRAKFMTTAWMLGIRVAHLAQKYGITSATVSQIIGREIPARVRDQLRRTTGIVNSYEQLDAIQAAFYAHINELEVLPLAERARRTRDYMHETLDTLEPESRIGTGQEAQPPA